MHCVIPDIVIARQNVALQIFCGVASALAAWALLHHPDEGAKSIMSVLVGAAAAGMAVVAFYTPVMLRGRGIWIADGRVFLASRRGIVLDDITDARAGTHKVWVEIFPVTLKTVELHGAGGMLGWVPAILLQGKRDAILARLNDALARHRAAGGPAATP